MARRHCHGGEVCLDFTIAQQLGESDDVVAVVGNDRRHAGSREGPASSRRVLRERRPVLCEAECEDTG